MENQEKLNPASEKEIDMGVFLNALSRSVKKAGHGIALFFVGLFDSIIWFLLFLKNNIIWLAVGALVGASYGLYVYQKSGPSYYSDLVVRANFESSRLLYQKIDYFNALIRSRRLDELQKLFNIDVTTASKLKSFRIDPVKDPLQVSDLYRKNYLDYKRNNTITADTSWTRTMTFKDFETQLTKYDFPLHTIRMYSANAIVFPKIQEGLIREMNNNAILLYIQQTTGKIYQEEEQLLSSSIQGLDSLRVAYIKRILENNGKERSEGSNVFLSQTPAQTAPEIEIYDKTLILKDELSETRRKNLDQKDILQVYSDFNRVGTRTSSFNEAYANYAWIGCLLALIILLLIKLLSLLKTYERNSRRFQVD